MKTSVIYLMVTVLFLLSAFITFVTQPHNLSGGAVWLAIGGCFAALAWQQRRQAQ